MLFCPYFFVIVCFMKSAISCVSEASIVVWLTTPTLLKWISGSKPSEQFSWNTSKKALASIVPCMKSAIIWASFKSFMTMDGEVSLLWENVAFVSSWFFLQWMMTVWSSLPSFADRFQTFYTNGHVVLYWSKVMFFSSSNCLVSTVAPKAGMITMS